LCPRHHTQFTRAKAAIPAEFREEFERIAIEQGKLAPHAANDDNAFSSVVDVVEKMIDDQRKQDDATLKAAETAAQYRRGKRPPESP